MKLRLPYLYPLIALFSSCALLLFQINSAAGQTNGFWENKGQVMDQDGHRRDDILYTFEQDGFILALGTNFFSFQLCSKLSDGSIADPTGTNDLHESPLLHFNRTDVKIAGAAAEVVITASGSLAGIRNFNNQNGSFSDIRQFRQVMYQDIYEGIDLVFYTVPVIGSNKARLKYDFIVREGADMAAIQLSYSGSLTPDVNEQGELISLLPQSGFVKESRPLSYFNDEQDSFYVAYQHSGSLVSFSPVNMKDNQVLTIDPEIIWSLYLGGVKDEFVEVLESDELGNFYACGQTYSPMGIVTTGAYQVTKKGTSDCFISKISMEGIIQWSTYFGGNEGDFAFGMCVDGFGGLYVCGQTNSQTGIATDAAYQKTYGGQIDGFLAKFNTDGLLLWSTFFGGAGKDQVFSVVADQTAVYLGGYTESAGNIATSGADQPIYAGAGDAFVSAFTPSGSIKFSTYLGGADQDRAHDIHMDHFGNLLVTGTTPSEDGIALGDVHQSTVGGNSDAFIARYSKAGHKKWCTYFGGLKTERGREIVPDGDGNCYVTGPTGSGLNIATIDAYQTLLNGSGPATDTVFEDAYLAKFDSTGKLVWATYYGGEHDEMGAALKWLTNGIIIVGGTTKSNFLVSTPDAIQPARGGQQDGFLAIFSEDGRLVWSTYYGGKEDEYYKDGYGPALDVFDNRFLFFGVSTYSEGLGTINEYTPSSTSIPSSDGLFLTIDLQCLDFLEPNNIIAKPHDLGIIDQSVFVEALMNFQGDHDYYTFEKLAGLPIKIELENLEQNCDLILFNSLYQPIKKASHAGLGNEVMNLNTAISGKFYLNVFSPGGGFSKSCYKLHINKMEEVNKAAAISADDFENAEILPNPADRQLSVRIYGTGYLKSAICLSDLSGKLLSQQIIQINEGENRFEMDVSRLEPGTYLLQILNTSYAAQMVLIY